MAIGERGFWETNVTRAHWLLCEALAQLCRYDEQTGEWDTQALGVAAEIAEYLQAHDLVEIHCGAFRRLLFSFKGEAARLFDSGESDCCDGLRARRHPHLRPALGSDDR